MESTEAAVLRIVAEQLIASVTPATTFEELGADSLDIIELVMALEEELDIEFPDAEVKAVQTVQQLIDLAKAKRGEH